MEMQTQKERNGNLSASWWVIVLMVRVLELDVLMMVLMASEQEMQVSQLWILTRYSLTDPALRRPNNFEEVRTYFEDEILNAGGEAEPDWD